MHAIRNFNMTDVSETTFVREQNPDLKMSEPPEDLRNLREFRQFRND